MMPKGLRVALRTFVAISVGLAIGLAATTLAGENPLNILLIIIRNAFGSAYDTAYTCFYAAMLMMTGLAVLIPYRAGLFNIGAEGQMLMGALAVSALGIGLPWLPSFIAWPLCLLVAMIAGAIWGGVAGALRTWRGGHEVISSIMLNYIAAALVSYAVLYLIKDPQSQTPESALIGENFRVMPWDIFEGAPFSAALFLAPILVFMAQILIERSRAGFLLRASGMNARATELGGVDTGLVRFHAMAWGGAIAGIAGFLEIISNAHRFRLGFSPEFGFTGIAVALVARARPWALIPSAFLFAAVHKGTSGLDLDSAFVTRDLSMILQAAIILAVTAERLPLPRRWFTRPLPQES